MSIQTHKALEAKLALDLFYGYGGPFRQLSTELTIATSICAKQKVVKKLMETYLVKEGKTVRVNLEDERIQDLFDEAIKNMAHDSMVKAIAYWQMVQGFVERMALQNDLLQNKPIQSQWSYCDVAKCFQFIKSFFSKMRLFAKPRGELESPLIKKRS